MTIYIVWPYSQFMTFHCKFMTLRFISIIYRMPGFPSPHFSLLCVFLQGPTNTLVPQLSLQVGPSGDNPTPPPCQGSVAFAGSVHFPTFISFLFFFLHCHMQASDFIAFCTNRRGVAMRVQAERRRCATRLRRWKGCSRCGSAWEWKGNRLCEALRAAATGGTLSFPMTKGPCLESRRGGV